MRVRVEGHCDERGTREYNLALGARRANAVKEFLAGQGVAIGRIETISYGKERPICTDSNEACWAQNRRGVTTITGGPRSWGARHERRGWSELLKTLRSMPRVYWLTVIWA